MIKAIFKNDEQYICQPKPNTINLFKIIIIYMLLSFSANHQEFSQNIDEKAGE